MSEGKLNKVKLTGLWEKENQYGKYWTGKLEDGTLIMLAPNNQREGFNEKTGKDYNDPPFQLYKLVAEGN